MFKDSKMRTLFLNYHRSVGSTFVLLCLIGQHMYRMSSSSLIITLNYHFYVFPPNSESHTSGSTSRNIGSEILTTSSQLMKRVIGINNYYLG